MSIKRVAVAGCDEVAVLSAVVLARNLKGVEVTLVDAVTPDMRFFAEASSTSIFRALDFAGVDECDFIRRTSATFSLGNEFSDWAFSGQNFIHSFGSYGPGSGVVEFHHASNKLRASQAIVYEHFSLAAAAARAGKFLRPRDCELGNLPSLAEGLQFSLPACTALLYSHGRRGGLKHVAEAVRETILDSDGNIVALITASGQSVEADLFIDCTASKRLLIGAQPFHSWAECIPVNACVMALQPNGQRFPPFSRARAGKNYWLKQVSLVDTQVLELHFNSHQMTIEQAVAELQLHLGTGAKNISPLLTQQPGRCEQFWVNNCVAIGESAAVLDRVSHSALAIAQLALARLLDLFPGYHCNSSLRAEYNRIAIAEVERVRDYHALHYHLLHKLHPLFVAHDRLPEDLQYKLELFKTIGRIPAYEHETLSTDRWISLLLGMELWPARYDPVADTYPIEIFEQTQQQLRSGIARMLDAMPDHYSYLARMLAQPSRDVRNER
jgi:tryptophan 7-halogenase